MKKILSFVLLLGGIALAGAQAQIGVKYDGLTYQNGDTLVVILAHDAGHCYDISFVNQTYSVMQNLVVTMTEIENAGVEAWGLCTSACVADLVSAPFNIAPSGEYTDFIIDLTVDEEVAQPYGVYNMQISNGTITCNVVVRLQAYAEGIDNVLAHSLSAYPNPAHGNVNISYDVDQPATLAVYDMQGHEVRQMAVAGSGNAIIGNLPAGIYVYGLLSDSHKAMQKLVVK